MSFEDLIQLPIFERKESIRRKVFKGFWMTTQENFKIVKKLKVKMQRKKLMRKRKKKLLVKHWQRPRKLKL